MRLLLIVGLLLVVTELSVEAGPFRRSRQPRPVAAASTETETSVAVPQESPAPQAGAVQQSNAVPASNAVLQSDSAAKTRLKGCDDALQEVNAERAERGLPPFLPDPLLNQAASACAKIRAARFIEAHLDNDFAYLPAGASATAAGCGALEPSWGWGTCCTYDPYTYAGAAWVMGTDGKRYMHLFVR